MELKPLSPLYQSEAKRNLSIDRREADAQTPVASLRLPVPPLPVRLVHGSDSPGCRLGRGLATSAGRTVVDCDDSSESSVSPTPSDRSERVHPLPPLLPRFRDNDLVRVAMDTSKSKQERLRAILEGRPELWTSLPRVLLLLDQFPSGACCFGMPR